MLIMTHTSNKYDRFNTPEKVQELYNLAKVLHIRHSWATLQPMTDRNTSQKFLSIAESFTLQDLTRKEHGYAHWCIDTKNGTKWWYYIAFSSLIRTDLINKWKQSNLSDNHICILIDGNKYCWLQMNKADMFMKSVQFQDKYGNSYNALKDQFDTDTKTGEKLNMLWHDIPESNVDLDTRPDYVLHIRDCSKYIYRNIQYSSVRNRGSYIYVTTNHGEVVYKSLAALYRAYKDNVAVQCTKINGRKTFEKNIKAMIINHSITEQGVINAITLNNNNKKGTYVRNIAPESTPNGFDSGSAPCSIPDGHSTWDLSKVDTLSLAELALENTLDYATDMGCFSRPIGSEDDKDAIAGG